MNGLLNVVGLTIGVALYAMLLSMVIGGRHARAGVDRLALATALLGLTWNVYALCVYAFPAAGLGWVAVGGFSALGFLPAVVVHSVVRGDGRSRRSGLLLLTIAYGAGTLAAVLHAEAALASRGVPSVLGLQLLTVCFIGMLGPLAVLTRGEPGARRALWGVALAAFAVSAMHLSQYHERVTAWPVELAGHHASIPLAVAILYQDYPFAFADLFLKRAITLIALVCGVSAAVWVAATVFGPAPVVSSTQIGAVMVLWVVTALAYPRLAKAAGWFVDSILLTRPDYGSVEIQLARRLQQQDDVSGVLDDVCAALAIALTASSVRWYEDDREAPADVSAIVAVEAGRRADVRIPVTELPRYCIHIHDLTHGRRILSGDVTMLSAVAVIAARRIDGVRLARERYAQQTREREIAQLATEAELRALRAQLNPHFLFNALTTIGYLIQEAPDRAVETLLRLTTLLRAVLKPEGEFTTLGRELELVDAYLSIERARFEDRLRVKVDVPSECRDVRVPCLLVQPLVENAIKHGIAPARSGGEVTIAARLSATAAGQVLTVTVTDAKSEPTRSSRRRWTRGVGLTSVERRLACHYGASAGLRVTSDGPSGTVVEVTIPAPAPSESVFERSAG